jgi:hypothetical protein
LICSCGSYCRGWYLDESTGAATNEQFETAKP